MTKSARRHDADHLGEYWDARLKGRLPIDHSSDAALAAAIDWLHGADDAPPPDATFARRLRAELFTPAVPEQRRNPSIDNAHARRAASFLQPCAAVIHCDGPARPWPLSHLATAALVLLTLVGGLIVAGPPRSWSPQRAISLPAVVSSPASENGVVTRTLFETTVADVPAGTHGIYLEQWRFKPGAATLTIAADDPFSHGFEGPRWLVADRGSCAVTWGGVEHSLRTGEGLLLPAGQELVIRDAGETEARLLYGGFTTEYPLTQYDSRFITYFTTINSTRTMSPGAARVVVEELTLEPGATVPAFTLGDSQWIGIGGGTVGVTLEGDRLPLYWDPADEREVAFPSFFPAITPGTRLTLRNAGDDELLLYRLTIERDSAGAALTRGAGQTVATPS